MDLSRPPWFVELVQQVDAAFEHTGADTPGWPAPHPDRAPLEEEYSRCEHPEKYAIVAARVEAWTQVLVARGAAVVAHPAATTWVVPPRPPEHQGHVIDVSPTGPGPAFVLVENLVDRASFGMDLGVRDAGDPTVLRSGFPVCGCDACDDGSEQLLEELDDHLLQVLRGWPDLQQG